jgi:hypothetical protein
MEQIKFFVDDIEDVLAKGLIFVGVGFEVGVLLWFCMGSWCYFLGPVGFLPQWVLPRSFVWQEI